MAKFPRAPKLNRAETEDIIIDLCEAIAATRNSQEAAQLLTDLLGKQELEMLARRLRVAELLIDGRTYDEIRKRLKISTATIARVQVWLQQSGEGYRAATDRARRKRKVRHENEKPANLKGLKRKYPLYYWPQIMLEYWVKNSTEKQKNEMRKILSKINDKPEIYKEIENQLKQELAYAKNNKIL